MTPVGWTEQRLGELINVKHGYAFAGRYFGTTGEHVVLTPGNFFEEGGFKDKGTNEKRYDGPIPPDYVLKRGDLIVAMTEQSEGLLGSSAIIPRTGVYLHNQRLGLVQPRDDLADTRYLYYLFNHKTVRQQIRASASGVKIRHTAPSRIAEVKVDVPPLAVQREIAGILSAYDALIENNLRRIRILEEMARALYREWFVEFRFPGHDGARRASSALGPIPRGWTVAPLSEACVSIEDGDWIETKDQGGGDYRLIQISNLGVGEFIETGNCRFVTQKTFERLRCNEVMPNDVLIARMPTPIGRAWLVEAMPWRTVTAVDVAIVRTRPELLDPIYYVSFWNSPGTLERLAKQASGTTRPRITRRDVAGFEMLLPPPKLQELFRHVVAPSLRMRSHLRQASANLRKTRDLLLPRLLSGKIALKDRGA